MRRGAVRNSCPRSVHLHTMSVGHERCTTWGHLRGGHRLYRPTPVEVSLAGPRSAAESPDRTSHDARLRLPWSDYRMYAKLSSLTRKPGQAGLSGSDQQVRGQVRGLQCSPSRMIRHRPKGSTSPRSDRRDERSSPVASPRGNADCKGSGMSQRGRDERGSQFRSAMDRIKGDSSRKWLGREGAAGRPIGRGQHPLTAKAC